MPVTKEEFLNRGVYYLDFIIISADAYVDHPAFAPALLGRYLESLGFNIGIIAQPDWHNIEDFHKLGRPRHAFLIFPGNVDAMVSGYTVSKKVRHDDAYSEGGKAFKRPKRPVITYTAALKKAYPDVPVLAGGIESSLRRFAHYDYWEDKVLPSVLIESGADMLVYGMGELPLKEIASRFKAGKSVKDMKNIRGTCFIEKNRENLPEGIRLDSFKEVKENRELFAECFKTQYYEQDYLNGQTLIQAHGSAYLVQNAPMRPLTTKELDAVYALPFTREQHPMYKEKIPALEEVKFSLAANRGCFGSCSFCAIHFHQGKHVQKRSRDSLVEEAKKLTGLPDFKGYIHDVGGPTANFTQAPCEKFAKKGECKDKSCLSPVKCPNLKANHREYLEVLRALREIPGIKKVFIRSGIRFDYLMYDPDDTFMKELIKFHISGQLKVAPEHVSERVLTAMRKPEAEVYRQFSAKFKTLNEKFRLKQYLVPYFISSHPGSSLKDAIELAEYLRDTRFMPDQVQDFYPTPGTLSTCMYYTGIHPLTGKKIYVPRTAEEKNMQRALLQYSKPENYALVKQALLKEGRTDLIGFHPKALIPPRPAANKKQNCIQAKNRAVKKPK